ncbi:MAG: hypothetical protein ATN34_04500 [Epulopiscium sp. Nele67-Bin002]|nr:MAG: hypothetical protein BEN18_00490 [Epulopiscium sp. Nuni2H_MBin001]OON90744.1 MAG: hypothetical protein ATN33_02335 [Epulopiscium sp. Nele67-Bin001]OON91829.1 MAG: hypothetical protein ATN34_04500 [Epulopiscium sp. Nele67-Bin002]
MEKINSSKYHDQLSMVESELNAQLGMVWLLGEVMKSSNEISSLKDLMATTTDMILGVTGVSSCYLWTYNERYIKIYSRRNEDNNRFKFETLTEQIDLGIPLDTRHLFFSPDITSHILCGSTRALPKSRLYVPLYDFTTNVLLGGMVLEHAQEVYFSLNKCIFFETLGVFIALKIKNANLLAMVAEESEVDPMTRVYNRRSMDKLYNYSCEVSPYVTIVIIDIDNFKRVNDEKGHGVGDEVVKAVAKTAHTYVEPFGGCVMRYGGDEFVLFIPQTLEEAISIIRKLQNTVPELPVVKDTELPITLTIGICTYPDVRGLAADVIQIADNALIHGKKNGKNNITLYQQGMMVSL